MTEFTIKPAVFRQALTTALAFAANDDVPAITAVRVTSTSAEAVEFAATDRYAISVEKVPVDGLTGKVEFSIPRDIAKRLLMLIPRSRRQLAATGPIAFTTDDDKVTIRITGDVETAITYTPYEEFVNYQKFFSAVEGSEPDPAPMMGFTPTIFSRACKAIADRGNSEPMRVFFHGKHKILIRHGDEFKAMVMAVRLREQEESGRAAA